MMPPHVLAGSVEKPLTIDIKQAVWTWAWNNRRARVIVPEFGSWVDRWKIDIAFAEPTTRRAKPDRIHYVEVKISKADLRKDIHRPDPDWDLVEGAFWASIRSAIREFRVRYGAVPRLLLRDGDGWFEFAGRTILEQARWPWLHRMGEEYSWKSEVGSVEEMRRHWWWQDQEKELGLKLYLDGRVEAVEKDVRSAFAKARRRALKVGKFYDPQFLSQCHHLWVAVPPKLVDDVPERFGVLVYRDGKIEVHRKAPVNDEFPADDESEEKHLVHLFYREAARVLAQRLAQAGGANIYQGGMSWPIEKGE